MTDKIKMSLSYRKASKLSDEQKCKVIACQASRVSIAPWEVEALLNFCQTNGKGSIDRGMALMYEYAGYMDSMRLNTNQRSDCMADIAIMIRDFEKYSLNVIEEKIITATGMTYNTMHALGQWRRLQWSPKTLFLTDSEDGRKSLQSILEDEANIIVNAILTMSDDNLSRLQSIDIIKLESLAALVSPCIDYPEFAKLFAFKKSYNNLRLKLMFSTMKDMLSVESNIEASWESVRRATELSSSHQDASFSSGLSHDPSLLYPTLRLSYDSSCYPPTEDLSWFNESTHKYEALDAVIAAVIAAHEAPGQAKALVGSKDKPSHDRRIDASHAVESTPQVTEQVQDTSIVIQKYGKKKDALKMYSGMKRQDEVSDRVSIIADESAITSSGRHSSLVPPSISPRPLHQASAVQKGTSPRGDESDQIYSSSSRGGDDLFTEHGKQLRTNALTIGNTQLPLELPAKSNNMNEDNTNRCCTDAAAETIGDLRKRSVTIATVSHTDPSVVPTLETIRRVTHGGEMTVRLTEASLIMFHQNRNVLESVQDTDSEISGLESAQSSPSKLYTDDIQLVSKKEDDTYMHNHIPDKEVKLGHRTYDLSVDGSTVGGEMMMNTAHLEEDGSQPLENSEKLNAIDQLMLDVQVCGSQQSSEETEQGIIIEQQPISHEGTYDTNCITAADLPSDGMTLTSSEDTIGTTCCDMEQRVSSSGAIVDTLTSSMDAEESYNSRFIHLAVDDNSAASIDIDYKYLQKIEDITVANNPTEEVDISEHDDVDDGLVSPEFFTAEVMLEAVVPIAMRESKSAVTTDYNTIDDQILAMEDASAVVYEQAMIVHEEPSSSSKPARDTSSEIDVLPSTDRHAMTVIDQSKSTIIDQSKSTDSNQSVQVENLSVHAHTEVEKVSAGSETNQIYVKEVVVQRETSILNHFPSLDSPCNNEVMQEEAAATTAADFNLTVKLSEETSQTTAVKINRNEESSDVDDFIQNDDDLSSFSPDRTQRSRNVSFEYLFKEFSDSTSDNQETSPTVPNWQRKRAVSSPAVSIGGLHQLRSSRALSTRTIQSTNIEKNEILDTLSRPFVQYHERSNREEINIALRNLRVNGKSVEEIAVTKLQMWWRLVFPRKKLMKRIHARDLCKEIAYGCAEDAMNKVMMKRAKRRRMLRIGACLTIQRCFRKFRLHFIGSLRNIRLKRRSDRAWYLLETWRRAAAAGIRIYRYLRYLNLKRIIKTKKIAGKKDVLLRRTVLNYIHALTLHKKLEVQKRLLERTTSTFVNDQQKAAIIIQKYYRRYSVILTMLNRKVFNVMYSKITCFFIRFVARRRVRFKMKKEKSVKLIQKIFRGYIARKHVLHMVTSGLILKYTWKKYQFYKSLKSQLRRIDRPYTITMHGIRNLQRSTLNSKQLKFKISIWWHPLLHIVSRSDVDATVNSRQPQLTYTSSQFEVQNEEVDNNARRTSIVDGFRMIGSSLLSAPTIVGRNNLLSIHASNPITSRSNAVSLRPLSGMTIGPPINKNVPLSSENLSNSSGNSSSSSSSSVVGRNRSSSVLSINNALPSRMIQKTLTGTKEEVEVEEDSDDEDDDDEYNVDEDVQVKTEALKARRSFLIKRMMMSHDDPSSSINGGVVNTSRSVLKNSSSSSDNNDNNSFTAMLNRKKTDTTVVVPDVSQVYRKRPTSILGRLTIMRNPRISNWDSKLLCSFENQVIKIPGCHGNSVIKFDIIDGDRVHGTTTFYMNRDGEMMYWGGTYNLKLSLLKEQRRAAHHRVQDSRADDYSNYPVLDFKISSGGPLRSKCSWGRLAVRGKGPLRRLLQARRIFSSLVFDKWYRFYFSIDETGLSFFDSKFSNVATHLIPLKDFKEISVDIGAPIRESPTDAARNIVEDIHNVKLVTHSKDEIYMRFVDENTRLGWQEVLYNSVVFSITNDDDDDEDVDEDDDVDDGRSTNRHHIGGGKHFNGTSWYIDSVLKRRKYAIHSGIIYSSRRFNQLVDQPKSTFVSNLLNRLSLSPSDKECLLWNDEVINTSKDKDKQVLCKSSSVNNNSQIEIIKKDRVYKDDIMVDSDSALSSTIQSSSHEHSTNFGGYINKTTTSTTKTTTSTTTTSPFHTPTPKSSIMHKALKPNLTEVLRRQRSQIQF